MIKKKRFILIISYVLLLFLIGLILIIAVSRSKLNTQISIFLDTENETRERWNALSKVARYDEPAASDAIIDALNDTDPYLRMLGAQLCEKRKEFKAIPFLIQNLKDNSTIMHPKAGRSVEMVKIASFKALKSITGLDLGVIEATPAEVAETIRKWELWWLRNAALYGADTEIVKVDYETAILSEKVNIPRRLQMLFAAEHDDYPGLSDIVVQLLSQKGYSLLKRRAIVLAGKRRVKEAIPLLTENIADETLMEVWVGTSLPLVAMWSNAALVQITGKDIGPVYKGITPKEQKNLVSEWKKYFKILPESAN